MSRDLTPDELQAYKTWYSHTTCQTCLKPNGRYWCDKCEKSKCDVCGQGKQFIYCPLHD